MIDNEYFDEQNSHLGGRGLFAKKFIKKGTQILIEKHISCVRNFTSPSDKLNSFFDFPKIIPKDCEDGDILLLGTIIENLPQIQREYGAEWNKDLYKSEYDTFSKNLTYNAKKYIAELSVKYQPEGGFKHLVEIYNSISHNCFKSMKPDGQGTMYYMLDHITSKFNHSCKFNCHYLTLPKHTIISTIEDVKEADELTIFYRDQLKTTGIICKCGECNSQDKFEVYCNNKFTIMMMYRENTDDYIKPDFNITDEIQNYIKGEEIGNGIVFGGVELWYHLLCDTYRKIDMCNNILDRLSYHMLLIYYTKEMTQDLSIKKGIDEEEFLIFALLNMKFGWGILEKGDYVFEIIKERANFKLTFNPVEDVNRIFNPVEDVNRMKPPI